MTYNNAKSCNAATGVPLAVLKLAKGMACPGFNLNNTINFDLVEPWLKDHEEELELKLHDTLEYYRKENEKRGVILKDLEIKKRKAEYLDPAAVKEFLQRVALSQNSLFVSRFKELPPKLAGKSALEIDVTLKQVVQDVCSIFSKELSAWNPQ